MTNNYLTDADKKLSAIVGYFGFLTSDDVAYFLAMKSDKLANLSCLVRGSCGRRVCAMRDVPAAVAAIDSAPPDYVRDVSLLPAVLDDIRATHLARMSYLDARLPPAPRRVPQRDHYLGDSISDTGYCFDGAGFVSDADPGL